MSRALRFGATVCFVAGCAPHASGLPPGPPPEYEQPPLPAWGDGGAGAAPGERKSPDAEPPPQGKAGDGGK
jgi:hypothetical protein